MSTFISFFLSALLLPGWLLFSTAVYAEKSESVEHTPVEPGTAEQLTEELATAEKEVVPAQIGQTETPVAENGKPSEPTRFADKISPLKSTQGFLRFAEQGNYPAAAEYLDLRNLPAHVREPGGPELARQLYVVLARKARIDFASLSDDPRGSPESGVPDYRELLTRIEYDKDIVSIFLQRVPDGEGASIWKISNASIAYVPDLYKKYGYGPTVEFVRELFPNKTFLGAEIFKWVIAIVASLLAVTVWYFASYPLVKRFMHTREGDKVRIDAYLHKPVAAVIFFTTAYAIIHHLGTAVSTQGHARANTVIIVVLVWLIYATADLIRDIYVDHLKKRGRDSALMLIRPVLATFKLIVGVLAFVTWLDNVGINITALLAGLGVGGLAVALVLQKPLEDILGALSLYTQQPVTVGQFCTSGDTKGTIEEIGIRTTKIRTIQQTLVAIPNAVMARASIENISERPQILHRQIIRIAVHTPHSKLRSLLVKLRDILNRNPHVNQGNHRVRLIGFAEFSIDIEVFAFILTTDWPQFLEFAENINLAMIHVLEEDKVELALPRF